MAQPPVRQAGSQWCAIDWCYFKASDDVARQPAHIAHPVGLSHAFFLTVEANERTRFALLLTATETVQLHWDLCDTALHAMVIMLEVTHPRGTLMALPLDAFTIDFFPPPPLFSSKRVHAPKGPHGPNGRQQTSRSVFVFFSNTSQTTQCTKCSKCSQSGIYDVRWEVQETAPQSWLTHWWEKLLRQLAERACRTWRMSDFRACDPVPVQRLWGEGGALSGFQETWIVMLQQKFQKSHSTLL